MRNNLRYIATSTDKKNILKHNNGIKTTTKSAKYKAKNFNAPNVTINDK
jgi:hypothetical protein